MDKLAAFESRASVTRYKKPIVWPVLAGNTLEFFDLGLYGCLSPILASKFFPSTEPMVQIIGAAGLFAAGFVTRPLGAIIFGHIADSGGRKKSLSLTMAIMGLATLLVSFLPTYAQIGILAPILLTFLRLIQGICAGGEYNSAAVFILEHTKPERRGFASGIITATSILGFFMASLAIHVTITNFSGDWAWRLPFLFGSLVALVSYILRLKTMETPEFLKSLSSKRTPDSSSFISIISNFRAMTATIGVGWFAGVLSLTIVGFLQQYLLNFSQIAGGYEAYLTQITIFVYLVSLPMFGLLSDYFTPKKVMTGACLLGIGASFPIFLLLLSNSVVGVGVGVLLLSCLAGSFLGPMHSYMFSIFPMGERCRGISMGFSIGVAIFGGSAPLISAFLMKSTGLLYAPAFYFLLSSFIGLIAVSLKRHSPSHRATKSIKPHNENRMRPKAKAS